MKFSESEIRAVIQEALGNYRRRVQRQVEATIVDQILGGKASPTYSQQKIDSLFNIAKNKIISYIDDPAKADRTYRARMNKKLKSLGLTKLLDIEVEKIKEFIKSLSIKIVPGGKDRLSAGFIDFSALAWYDTSRPLEISMYDFMVDGTSDRIYTEEMIVDTLYHELYHALDTAFFRAGIGVYNSLLGTHKYRENQGLQKAADEITKKIKAFEKRKEGLKGKTQSVFSSEGLLAKEIKTIIDEQALSNPRAWNKKVKEVFPHLKVTKFYPFLSPFGQAGAAKTGRKTPDEWTGAFGRVGYTGDLGHVRKLWKDPAHVYVAIQQLRRVFQDKTLAEICNLDSKQLWKKLFYSTVGRSSELLLFFVSLKCTPESTKAFEMIAKSTADGKLGTKTV
tara:strand:- start:741 stop:1919 length:1179 start_codon:yes stop_codon:yes gene_type:complete